MAVAVVKIPWIAFGVNVYIPWKKKNVQIPLKKSQHCKNGKTSSRGKVITTYAIDLTTTQPQNIFNILFFSTDFPMC